VYFSTREFIEQALERKVEPFHDLLMQLYLFHSPDHSSLLIKAIEALKDIIDKNGNDEHLPGGLKRVSKGALVMFKRKLASLNELRQFEAFS